MSLRDWLPYPWTVLGLCAKAHRRAKVAESVVRRLQVLEEMHRAGFVDEEDVGRAALALVREKP